MIFTFVQLPPTVITSFSHVSIGCGSGIGLLVSVNCKFCPQPESLSVLLTHNLGLYVLTSRNKLAVNLSLQAVF